MVASVRFILSVRAAWAVANDADVEKNMRTASMMVRKSWVDIVICCRGDAEVLDAATSGGAVLGAWGLEKKEGNRASGTERRGRSRY